MVKSFYRFVSLSVVLSLLIIVLSACQGENTVFQPTPSPKPTQVIKMSSDQVADIVQKGNFFTDYADKTIVISGPFAAAATAGQNWVIEIGTNSTTHIYCNLGNNKFDLMTGDPIMVSGSKPDKVQTGVLFNNCVLLVAPR